MTYALQGAALLSPRQANRAMGWTAPKLKKYWDARARACQNMADEGACLAQVARHVPVTFAGSGGLRGLGLDIASAVDTAAALLRDPETYLRAHGPALVTSLDSHVIGPVLDVSARRTVPYLLKYIFPPVAVLYLISGLGLYYSFLAYKRGGRTTPNRRRRRRR